MDYSIQLAREGLRQASSMLFYQMNASSDSATCLVAIPRNITLATIWTFASLTFPLT